MPGRGSPPIYKRILTGVSFDLYLVFGGGDRWNLFRKHNAGSEAWCRARGTDYYFSGFLLHFELRDLLNQNNSLTSMVQVMAILMSMAAVTIISISIICSQSTNALLLSPQCRSQLKDWRRHEGRFRQRASLHHQLRFTRILPLIYHPSTSNRNHIP